MVRDDDKYWRFQIRWKQLEYFMPIKSDIKKKPLFTYSGEFFLKDENTLIIGLDTKQWKRLMLSCQ